MATATATKTDSNKEKTAQTEAQLLPCDVSKVKEGDLWTRHSAGEVTKVEKGRLVTDAKGNTIKLDVYTLKNDNGLEWEITANILEEEFSFADQFDSEEKLSRTEAIKILTDLPRTAMTVCFHKKVDHKSVAKLLSEGQGDKSSRKWNKEVKDAIAGELTEIKGYHTRSFDEHGYLQFIKLGGRSDRTEYRLVTPKTLEWFIANRKKYVVKSK